MCAQVIFDSNNATQLFCMKMSRARLFYAFVHSVQETIRAELKTDKDK